MPLTKIKVIAFDADDTLWVNETLFREAEMEFCVLMHDYLSAEKCNHLLFEMEMKNLLLYGYGIKPFTLSLIEAAIDFSDGMVPITVIETIIALGKKMLGAPIELLDGVEETLESLSQKYRLVMVTKGDLLDQERKLIKSGLEPYFHHIEIVSDKTEKQYQKLVNHLDIAATEFLMVGNSIKSDILPVALSHFDPEFMYYGTQRLYTSNRAVFWTAISPDLTDGQHPSGSGSYGTLTAIGPSHINTNTVYTGSDDGNVYVTFDGGTSWDNISAGLPNRYITSLAVSPGDDQIAYVTLSGYSVLDYDPHVFKTIDGGLNWVAISANLPNIPVNDIVIHPDEDLLIIATDLNVWYSQNDGVSWTILGDNLPLTLTRDIKIHQPTNTLYAGTYGRSMHSFDLNTLILNSEEFTSEEKDFIIYPIPATTQISLKHHIKDEGSLVLYDINGSNTKN